MRDNGLIARSERGAGKAGKGKRAKGVQLHLLISLVGALMPALSLAAEASGTSDAPWVRQWVLKWGDDPTAVFTSIIAALTLVLAIIGWWQGRQLKRTVQSFVLGERPYLFIDAPEPRVFPEGPNAVYPQGKPTSATDGWTLLLLNSAWLLG
jgi:hypothetical protein